MSTIVIDEVHERSLETDFLLALVPRLLKHYSHLKVCEYHWYLIV